MIALRNNPHIYEINLATWLNHLSGKEGRGLNLAQIPLAEWEDLKKKGMDAVWLMGIWERSPLSAKKARETKAIVDQCQAVLTDFKPNDICGSPYAVKSYRPEPRFGTFDDVVRLKEILHDYGLALVLDFVPNHTACDHAWVFESPYLYLQAAPVDKEKCPDGFFYAVSTPESRTCIAHGRDPYFSPWTDTAQLNYMNPRTQDAMVAVLQQVSTYCDGVRCDMAMLLLDEVFKDTWKGYLPEDAEAKEFWPIAINSSRSKKNNFVMVAEVYWGLGKKLLEAGFDFVYDKDLYDLLVQGNIAAIRKELCKPVPDQGRMLRFVENHDEPRALSVFGNQRIRSALVIHATLPGAKLWHHGQMEGNRLSIPVQLSRAPEEVTDEDLASFCGKLLREVNEPVFHEGIWQMCAIDGWPENQSHENLLAWSWQLSDERRIIIVNFSPSPSQGRIRVPCNWFQDVLHLRLWDPIKGDSYLRPAGEIKKNGLYAGLDGWDFHFFRIERK